MRRWFGAMFLIGALLWVASPAAAAEWHFETLDGDGGANGRIESDVDDHSAVTLFGGQPHAFYVDVENGNLRHAVAGGSQWFFDTLDGDGGTSGRIDADVGYYSAARVFRDQNGDQFHVWYWDATNGDLRHGWYTSQWHFETIDGNGDDEFIGKIDANVGIDISESMYGAHRPHVWYLDSTNGDLRHGGWSGQQWKFETLDGAGASDPGPPSNGRIDAYVGAHSAVTLYADSYGVEQPHVWYRNDTNGDLRHTWFTDRSAAYWGFETLDGAGGSNGRINADVGSYNAATLYGGQPHVWFRNETNGDLRHGWWHGSQWFFETLDGAGGANGRVNADVGSFNAATLYGGQPHVWFRNETNGDLRHGWWHGSQWFFETLDGAGGTNGRINASLGTDSAVTLFEGQPHVWYADGTNGDLRHAWWG